MADGPTGDEREDGEAPVELSVYAVAASLAGATPVPWLDRALASLARGAALRRVASRHGVRLDAEARKILAGGRGEGGARDRAVSSLARRALAPLSAAGRIDDALSTWAAAVLLDHHLGTSGRPAFAPLGADEANRIRAAIASAEVRGALASLRSAPSSVLRAFSDAARAAFDSAGDLEDRTPAERFSDALLDRAASARGSVVRDLRAAFDDAMRRGAERGR